MISPMARGSTHSLAQNRLPRKGKLPPKSVSLDPIRLDDPDRWAANLYSAALLPDKRLRTRAMRVSAALAAKPMDSIPQACDSWASTKGAYRFIENKRVGFDALQKAASDTAARDCAGRDAILAIQDTTSLSFPTAPHTTGLGPVGNNTKVLGLHLHSVLASRLDGVPIGLLHQHQWARDIENFAKKKKNRPIEEKESFKWLRGVRAAREALAENTPEDQRPRLIHVGDCENDIHEVFEDILDAGDDMVIRSGQNRRAVDENNAAAPTYQLVAEAPLLGKRTLEVPRKHGTPRRKARLEIRAARITLAPNSTRYSKRRSMTLSLLEVREPRPPEDAEPLHWLLWTADPVESLAQALEIVEIYKQRWKIEELHLILKSGCRIEAVRFHTAERMAKAIALYSPVAVRILQLRDLGRIEPQAPCTLVLSENEWRALYTQINKKVPAPRIRPPTMRQAVLWIGRLGGHLGRKSDGMPGVRTLWRGWRDLEMLTTLFTTFHP